jgi:hypothetical protein
VASKLHLTLLSLLKKVSSGAKFLLTIGLAARQRQQRGGVMERRYLGATIAMAAIFALFSHGFSSGLFAKLHQPPTTLVSEAQCAVQTLRTRLLEKVNRSLGNESAEEAQLRVELNIPAPILAAPPVPPVAPQIPAVTSKQVQAPAAPPAVACRAPRLYANVKLPKNFNQIVQANVERAVRVQQIVVQTKLQSREFQRTMAQQSRELQRAMEHAQREMARANAAQARAAVYQAKASAHPCPNRSARVTSDNDEDNVDWGRFSREIEQEVSRSMDESVRNF